MIAGLEMLRYKTPCLRHDLYYWARMERNSVAEVDYVEAYRGNILPIEIKSGTQGGMKSLWMFLRQKRLTRAVRCSLENFGQIIRKDVENLDKENLVTICPLYAISQLPRLLTEPTKL